MTQIEKENIVESFVIKVYEVFLHNKSDLIPN